MYHYCYHLLILILILHTMSLHPISWPLLFYFFGQSCVLPLRDSFLTLRLPIYPSPFQLVFFSRDLFSQFVLGFCYRISLLHATGKYTLLVCPINDTCSALTILFNFFTLIFGGECKFWSSSLFRLLPSSLLGRDVPVNIHFSDTYHVTSSSAMKD